jgi:hypothetical protein
MPSMEISSISNSDSIIGVSIATASSTLDSATTTDAVVVVGLCILPSVQRLWLAWATLCLLVAKTATMTVGGNNEVQGRNFVGSQSAVER